MVIETIVFQDQYVRAANPHDAAQVKALLASEHLETEFIAKEFVVCESRGRILACIRARPLPEGGTEVASLVVIPEQRGRGISRDLVQMSLIGARHPVYALVVNADVFAKLNFEPLPKEKLPASLKAKMAMCDVRGPWTAMQLKRVVIPEMEPDPVADADFLSD